MSQGFGQVVLALAALVASAAHAASGDTLVVFTGEGSETALRFELEHLPRLRAAAAALGVEVRVLGADAGLPPEVTLTPLLVYQDSRGRSIFQGRYVDAGKLTHFIRTSRVVPPTGASQTRRGIPVLEQGRSVTGAPVKVTVLSGHPPEGHDDRAFAARAAEAISLGLRRFERRDQVEIGPSDRLFYMDFHPYLSAAGELFVTTALFSQFDCIEPVYSGAGRPLSGPWEEADRVFGEAAAALEAQILNQIASSTIGDAFDAVPASAPLASWQQLGLELPAAPAGQDAAVAARIQLPRRWSIAPAADGRATLVFNFAPPLERYSGEVRAISGELLLGEDLSLRGAEGWVEVRTESVTMGEPDLDQAIHQKMIKVAQHPISTYRLERIDGDGAPIGFGRTSPVVVQGRFTLMGLEIPLEVRGEVEPVIGADGRPRLRVVARAEFRLAQPFRLAGPDGPAPANDTLVLHLSLLLEAAS